jgi:2-polyprenyl-3-methyl-5-hydroxy-6-metoxy-1,4-benzoquinol methylase
MTREADPGFTQNAGSSPESLTGTGGRFRGLSTRPTPGVTTMSFIKSAFEHLTGRRTTQSRWDARWVNPSFYASFPIDELSHYFILAGYAKKLKPGGDLLDVGCGAGVLLDHLHPDAFATYTGVDFPKAIERAQPRVSARVSFVASDLREFRTPSRFDTIVFNEVLYYVDDPIAEIDRYAGFLNPAGVFVASTHRKPGTDRLWERLRHSFSMIDELTVANARGVAWIMGAFEPRR